MEIYIGLAAFILVLLSIMKFSRARIHDGFVRDLPDAEFRAEVEKLAEVFQLPQREGGGVDIASIAPVIKKANRILQKKCLKKQELYEYQKWLYENHYLFMRVLGHGFDDFCNLPHFGGTPRVLELSRLIVSASGCKISAQRVNAALDSLNAKASLNYNELSALPRALEYALLEKVAALCKKAIFQEKMFEKAVKSKKGVVQRYLRNTAYRYFYSKYRKIEAKKERDWESFKGIEFSFTQFVTENNIIASAVVNSLRQVGRCTADVMKYSKSYAALFQNKVFRESDTATKNSYMAQIGKRADKLNLTEGEYAQKLLELEQKKGIHCGILLFDFPDACDMYAAKGVTLELKAAKNKKVPLYVFTAVFCNLLFGAVGGWLTFDFLYGIPAALLTISATIKLSVNIADKVFKKMLKPRTAARLTYSDIPATAKTAVIFPVYLGGAEDALQICTHIKRIAAVNDFKNAQYIILADLPPSKAERDERDEPIFQKLKQELEGFANIAAVVRRRTDNGKGRFCGRERKRGAIEDFHRYLAGENNNLVVFSTKVVEKPVFCIVLDADNTLAPQAVLRAVNTISHPLNQKFDLLTFQGKFDLYSFKTAYSKRYLHSSGTENYPEYSAFYFNLSDNAVFQGKGIYRFDSFYQKLNGALPEDKVLSHDIIEGALLNTGFAAETTYEDAPMNFISDSERKRRWQRGDIQLLPFMGAKRADGQKIPLIYKFIIWTNAFTALKYCAIGALLLIALFLKNAELLYVAAGILAADFLMCFISTAAGLFKGRRLMYVGKDIAAAFSCFIGEILLLPYLSLDAFFVFFGTLCKMIFTKKGLLEWKTFGNLQKKAKFTRYIVIFAPAVALCAAVCLAVFFVSQSLVLYPAVYCLGHLAACFCMFLSERDLAKDRHHFDRETLVEYARKSYAYFENNNVNGLPADHFQKMPKNECASYTSPTNIGFGIIAEICAAALGFKDMDYARARVCEILDKTLLLQRWKGHLYNWYSLESGQPQSPCFVSSVDSGNFAAALIAAKEFFGGKVADRVDEFFKDFDIYALFDGESNQFYIGYNQLADRQEGHYDNLASEARLLSYIAVANGLSVSHWYGLARNYTPLFGNTLLSWSGTAFEYLMPALFLQPPRRSLLYTSEKNAAKAQAETRCKGLWGISECGYFDFDDLRNYKYYAFGISKLSERAENDKCVISPYSSFLCAQYFPKKAMNNLQKLQKWDMFSDFGFFEALDLSASPRIAAEFMAHHQGMSLAAAANLLCNDVIRKAFSSDLKIAGARALLAENQYECKAGEFKKNSFEYESQGTTDWEFSPQNFALPQYGTLFGDGYTVIADELGRGFSKDGEVYINRFRRDAYRNFGAFFYVKEGGAVFCPTRAPLADGDEYAVKYTPFTIKHQNLTRGVSQNIFIPAYFEGEYRELILENGTKTSKKFEVAFYSELSLNYLDNDESHRAFSNMFIETNADKNVLIIRRKGMSASVKNYCAVVVKGAKNIRFVSNRFNFVGRDGSVQCPKIFEAAARADDNGEVLEPCIGFVADAEIKAESSLRLEVAIIYSEREEELNKQILRAQSVFFGEYAKKSGIYKGKNEILDKDTYIKMSKLLSAVLYLPHDKTTLLNIAENKQLYARATDGFKRRLLGFDYHGNLDNEKLKDAWQICRCLNSTGAKVVLCVFYDESDGYNETVKRKMSEFLEGAVIGRNLIFAQNTYADSQMLKKTLFYSFTDAKFDNFLECRDFCAADAHELAPIPFDGRVYEPMLESGEGHFYKGGYEIKPQKRRTALPYSNIICGEWGGTVVTDNGGYTYFGNSRENKLTVWENDAVCDYPAERLWFVGEKGAMRLNGGTGAKLTHTQGLTAVYTQNSEIRAAVRQYIIDGGRHKVYEVEIEALHGIAGRLMLDIDTVLGWRQNPANMACKISEGIIDAVNVENNHRIRLATYGGMAEGAKAAVFSRATGAIPAYVTKDNTSCCAQIPAYCVYYEVKLERKSPQTFYFLISGADGDLPKVNEIQEKKDKSLLYFGNLNKFSVESGDKAFDFLFNDWLMYQVVSCRLNGRTSFYQAGGAIGFRDQLQDCLAFIYSDAQKAKEMILDIAAHLYFEGDAMHWWHWEKTGVRTRISDDKLFLPYVVCEYVDATGDKDILDEKLPYLISQPLNEYEKSRYETPAYSQQKFSLLSKLKRILNSCRRGENGLLLIGGGDWNDALDEVGKESRGESVWLSMFYFATVHKLLKYADIEERIEWLEKGEALRSAIENTFVKRGGGGQYARLVTADGEWLGAGDSDFMKIDAISQAWASLSGACDKARVNAALDSAIKGLCDSANGLIKLLWPPFGKGKYYGYISAYPQGVRENGGQYTHGAIWLIAALINENRIEEAWELFCMINPAKKCADAQLNAKYKGEPYVIAADVYSVAPYAGRAGWTWYTGSASWCYKTLLEGFLGIRLAGGNLEIKPRLPKELTKVTVEYRYKNSLYTIKLIKDGGDLFSVNGREIKNGNIVKLAENVTRTIEAHC